MQSISRRDALDTLKTLAHVAGRYPRDAETTKQVTVSAWPDAVSMRATNLAQTLTLHLPTTPAVVVEWQMAVDLKVMQRFITDSHSQVVTLSPDYATKQLRVNAICLNDYDGEKAADTGYPRVDPVLTIDAAALRKGLTMTQWAAATSDERLTLNAVNIKTDEAGFKAAFAASDGSKLSAYEVQAVGHLNIILPIAAAKILLKALPERGEVNVSTWKHTETRIIREQAYQSKWTRKYVEPTKREVTEDIPYARFDWGMGRMDTRLTEGIFPNYAQIIPKYTDTAITFAPNALVTIKQLAASYTKSESQGLRITPAASGTALRCKTESAEAEVFGNMTNTTPLGLNVRYLADILTMAGPDMEHLLRYQKPAENDTHVYSCLLLQEGPLTICQMPMHFVGAPWAK